MDFGQLFVENFVMVFELVGLLIVLFISAHTPKKIKFYIRLTIALLFFSTIVTAVEKWTQTFETLSLWRPILTATKYSIYPFLLYFVILLLSHIIKPIEKKWFYFMLIPAIVSMPFYYSSQWSQLIFYYTENNSYQGGPLKYWPYIVFGLYLLLFVVLNIIHLRHSTLINRIIALYIALASMAGVIVLVVLGITDNYNPIFASALVFYFIFIYIRMASIDPLTGLRNRQSYYQELIEKENRITFVASIDMNDLKVINDKQGHAAGDQALVTLAEILKIHSGQGAHCFRVGGDEFMILYHGSTLEEVESSVKKMREELAKTPYSCAFGYAEKKLNAAIDEAIKASDKYMYENKYLMKKDKKDL